LSRTGFCLTAYAFDDKSTSIFQTDVTDDVMGNAEPVKELDHVVGVLMKFGNIRLQSESVVVNVAVVWRRDEHERLAIATQDNNILLYCKKR